MAEKTDIFDFELTPGRMARIARMYTGVSLAAVITALLVLGSFARLTFALACGNKASAFAPRYPRRSRQTLNGSCTLARKGDLGSLGPWPKGRWSSG